MKFRFMFQPKEKVEGMVSFKNSLRIFKQRELGRNTYLSGLIESSSSKTRARNCLETAGLCVPEFGFTTTADRRMLSLFTVCLADLVLPNF